MEHEKEKNINGGKKMTLFEDSKMEIAYLKMGLYGEAGTGKSFTSSKVAIGLHKYIKAKKPIFFFDTETGRIFFCPCSKKRELN